jgi:hypothetical protein
MLDELSNYRTTVNRVVVVLTLIAAYVINKYFDWNAKLSNWYELFLYAGLVVAMFVGDNYLATLYERSKWLRTHLLGKRYLEGVWLELILTESDDLHSVAYNFVRVQGGAYSMDGYGFLLPDGRPDHWKSTLTSMSHDGDVDIIYKLTSAKTGRGDLYGYCKYSFTLNADRIPPISYTGSYSYALDGATYFVQARKINDAETADAVQRHYKEDFQRCMELCRRYFADGKSRRLEAVRGGC